MFRRILVPVDGSPCSARGLEVAVDLARNQEAELAAVHIVDYGQVMHSFGATEFISPREVESFLEGLRASGRRLLADAQERFAQAGVEGKTILCETSGQPVAVAIVEQARKLQSDLIVLGTHGRRGLARMVMGSDAAGVVRESPVPVRLVRAAPDAGSG
jgi:nucleotide-binding universal stress UspA family protein